MGFHRLLQWGIVASAAMLSGWTLTAPMAEARFLHTATLLASGDVLVAGGFTKLELPSLSFQGASLDTMEQYHPETDQWDAPAAMDTLPPGRAGHTATALSSGNVLIAGGSYEGGIHSSAIVYKYDGSGASWGPAGAMSEPRVGHAAVLLGGEVLVAGGVSIKEDVLATSELFKASTGEWYAPAPMSAKRAAHTLTKLIGGKVLAAGGFGALSSNPEEMLPAAIGSAEIYDPGLNQWKPLPLLTSSMAVPRYFHTATLLEDGTVLVAGGVSFPVPTNTAEVFNPKTSTWSPAPAMSTARFGHSAVRLSNGAVVVMGGLDHTFQPVKTVEIFDPSSGTWTLVGDMTTARGGHAAVELADGRALVVGGVAGGGDATTSAEVFELIDTGMDCSADAECESGYCYDAAPMNNFCCDAACDPDNAECVTEQGDCEAGGGGGSTCSAAPNKPDGTPCASGICLGGECSPDPTDSLAENAGGFGGSMGVTGSGGAGGAGLAFDDQQPRLVGGGCLGELPTVRASVDGRGAERGAAVIIIASSSVLLLRRRRVIKRDSQGRRRR